MRVNVSIDDVSPHWRSSTNVLDRCFSLLKDFPDMKFTLFVPIAYWRTTSSELLTKQALSIDIFPSFCQTLRDLPKTNFELCYHGLYHGIPGVSDNDEFKSISYEEAVSKFQTMFQIVERAGLSEDFKMIFRPPAWRMSPEAFRAAKDCRIQTLALSSSEYARKIYSGADDTFGNVVYYNCNPPFEELKVFQNNEIVYHACEWDKNYLSRDLEDQLRMWLKQQSDVEFHFIEALNGH